MWQQAAAGELAGQIYSVLQEEPLVVAAGIVVVILIAVIVRWVTRPMGVRFKRVLTKPDEVTVLMHPNPDPDAMASAIGVAHIAEQNGTPATIMFPGQIRHQENRAFQTVLDLSFEPLTKKSELTTDTVVLVDHNEPRGFSGAKSVKPFAVIDHHPGNGKGSVFTDVRMGYGACSSIIAEYLRDLDVELEPPEDASDNENNPISDGGVLPSPVATGLLYGILSDTNHLTRGCSEAEFNMSSFLYPGVDSDLLTRIANPPVDAEVLDTIATAIKDRTVNGPFAISNVGRLSNVDAIPQAAEELLKLEGVTAVVVYGEKDDTIHLSGRSLDDRVHMGNALKAAVEDIPMSQAGGHARMGGGQVSIAHLEGLRAESGMTNEEFTNRLFDVLGGNT